MDSDSDDENVFYGTPLPPLDEDEIVARRSKATEDETVKDAKGRQRFHGAFTGGFSAGFFNTVGSKDGFTPSTFVSSRSARAEKSTARPEDFMDDEDRGEFGIAPQRIQAKVEFRDSSSDGRRRQRLQFNETAIPGEDILEQLAKPIKDTMGIRIMKALGWKPGQGIGPRVTRKEKKQAKKVYGCAPPPGAGSAAATADSGSDSGEELQDMLYAPDDVEPPYVRRKMDRFGLGYTGLSGMSTLGSAAGDSTLRYRDKKGKVAIRGQAFGVGAFEEEDTDIYATEDMSNYDFEDAPEKPKQRKQPPVGLPALEKVLEGFHLSSIKLPPRPHYPPPPLPPNFKPEPKLRVSRFEPVPAERRGLVRHKLTAERRGELIGEVPPSDSSAPSGVDVTRTVMGGVDGGVASASAAHQATKAQIQPTPALSADLSTQSESSPLTTSVPGGSSSNLSEQDAARLEEIKKLLTEAAARSSAEGGSGAALKPFSRDPEKQKRYEQFLVLQSANRKDDYRLLMPATHTSWEREREISEFARAAALFRPLATSLADRFVSAGTVDEERAERGTGRREEDPAVAAAKKKMFGFMTRKKEVWRPASLLCKRFNVKDPFPQTNLVGTVAGSAGHSRSVFAGILAPTPTADTGPASAPNNSAPAEPPALPPPTSTVGSVVVPPRPRSKAGRLAWEWLIAAEDAADQSAGTTLATGEEAAAAVPTSSRDGEDPERLAPDGEPKNKVSAMPAETAATPSSAASAKKPPPDLFKAIFDNSSSEESDEEETAEASNTPPTTAADQPSAETSATREMELKALSSGADIASMVVSPAVGASEKDTTGASTGRPSASAFFGEGPSTAAPKKPGFLSKKSGFNLFAGVDLDELNSWKRNTELPARLADEPAVPVTVTVRTSSDEEYGPKLPPTPASGSTVAGEKRSVSSADKAAIVVAVESDSESDAEKWQEKSKSGTKSGDKKKKKHKKSEKKRKKRKRSSSDNDSGSDNDNLNNSLIEKLRSLSSKKKRKKSKR